MTKQFDQRERFFAQVNVAAHLCGVSDSTIDEWIKIGKLVERVHFIRTSDRMRLFNVELLRDRIANWDDDVAHQKGIQVYQASLLSNQSLQRHKVKNN
ncbi:hypothetical protein H6F86_00370 [Phormidium sp. FACHB-592]|uniref:MerR family transcriptional regulator n=1 Tax=Stenomitos frigidus AS-A4 TaxID=2933935 RepID=A0ABV0KSW5_9CYAN|nr:hypothetical protein [Phormidium sp. FACHB-592]MBD2072388.1 hypothetical protein [Phormidium sp. FACHB-592]